MHERELSNLKIEKTKNLAEIEANKFKEIVTSIGKETLLSISKVIFDPIRPIFYLLFIEWTRKSDQTSRRLRLEGIPSY